MTTRQMWNKVREFGRRLIGRPPKVYKPVILPGYKTPMAQIRTPADAEAMILRWQAEQAAKAQTGVEASMRALQIKGVVK